MPNTHVLAAAEGLPNLNRRRLLNLTGAGLALAVTAAGIRKAPASPIDATPGTRAKMSSELRAVIKAHRKADAYWRSVCGCTDSAVLGREATAKEIQKWEDASDGEYSALWYVCRFPARTTADLAAKGRHLKKYHSWYAGDLDNEQVRALLLSMSLVGKGGDA